MKVVLSGISTRDRRVLIAGAVAIAALVVLGRGIPALSAWRTAREGEASVLGRRLERANAAVRDVNRNRQLLAHARTQLTRYDAALLSGLTPTAASAHLSELLSEAAASSEAELGAVQLSADSSARTSLSRVTARTEITGTLEAIALFLDALEEGPRLLAVREVSITTSMALASPAQSEQLRATVVVEGIFPTPRRPANGR